MATSQDPLSRLPVDVLTDSLLPTIPTHDLVSLSRTCRRWHSFLTDVGTDCEIMWQRRSMREFSFPVRASGRRNGWYRLYSKLAQSNAYIWGQNDNGRLALPDSTFNLPTSLRTRVIEGGLVVPTRLELPAAPVSIVAGGWSFHALTAEGQVVSWGTLDGGSWASDDAPLRDEGRALRPTVLPQSGSLGAIAQVEAGRSHVVMLGQDGKVHEMRSFGRVVEIRDENQRWGTSASTDRRDGAKVVSVQAGWDYSAILTEDGEAFVWWQPAPAAMDRNAAQAGEDSLVSPSTEGVAFPLDIDTTRLPPLPSDSDKTSILACGDNFVIALTDSSRLYFLDLSAVPDPQHPHAPQGARGDPEDSPARSRASRARLENEFVTRRRTWRVMSRFCEMDQVEKLPAFDDGKISSDTRITHVTAHFNSFAAYSVPASADPSGSLVLLGSADWHEQAQPVVVPELQGIGVIKIAQGDYHSLALTSAGRLYSWGSFSRGALGLGHPVLSNTPLSAPPVRAPPATTGREEEGVRPHAMPRVHDPNRPLPPITRQPHPFFPGFIPARPAAVPPRAPNRVEKPTRVRFDGESSDDDDDETERRHTFVYAVTASGWHSGALAVDLSNSSSAPTGERDEPIIKLKRADGGEPDSTAHDAAAAEAADARDGTWMGRLGRPFRVGFAGRGRVGGINRGGAGGGVRPPSR
ncbi:hypothetical protein JCM10212_003179 [Sporobolomyces blumeae]